MPSVDEAGGVTDICFYGIVTTAGHVDVELRTDHNGYYGGWLNTPELVEE